jgi:nucleotide-binding universal stress UspA family protein
MSAGLVLAFVICGWIGIGLVLSLAMGRRGHDVWGWFVLGALLGPLAFALAIDARRHPTRAGTGRVLRPGRELPGTVDVLLGSDGSPESYAAMNGVKSLFGDRLRRVMIVTVIPFDAPHESEQRAVAALQRQALGAYDDRFGLQVVRGHAADALQALAEGGGYDVVAVGSRGVGLAKAALGSVATRLARGCGVPVLMFSCGKDADSGTGHDHESRIAST